MNINLVEAHADATCTESVQSEIDEHKTIMTRAGVPLSHADQVMLLTDPDYPGAYRVWLRIGTNLNGAAVWCWVNPDGEIINSTQPWGVK